MTSKSNLDRRLSAAEGRGEGPRWAAVYMVAIGGDPDRPTGWLSREEYEAAYPDNPPISELGGPGYHVRLAGDPREDE